MDDGTVLPGTPNLLSGNKRHDRLPPSAAAAGLTSPDVGPAIRAARRCGQEPENQGSGDPFAATICISAHLRR